MKMFSYLLTCRPIRLLTKWMVPKLQVLKKEIEVLKSENTHFVAGILLFVFCFRSD